MRVLLNHGLSISELYTNPTKLKKVSIEPFSYCIKLILEEVINKRVRFNIPNQNAYIDFEIVTGEKFQKQRQRGRFKDIDIIASEFTGYFINYYYKAKAYQKAIPIYLGGSLRKLFLDGINSGIAYYTTKDITINDFIDRVWEKYKDFTREEIKDILLFGFRRMHSAIKYGCAITLTSTKVDLYAYIGFLTSNPVNRLKDHDKRRDRKLRIIENWKRNYFNGVYYIGISSTVIHEWADLNKKSIKNIKFEKVFARKIKEEFFYKGKKFFIFQFDRKDFHGWFYWIPEIKIENCKYIGYTQNNKFYEEFISWKELRNLYGQRK